MLQHPLATSPLIHRRTDDMEYGNSVSNFIRVSNSAALGFIPVLQAEAFGPAGKDGLSSLCNKPDGLPSGGIHAKSSALTGV
jgi:hypothetical protein